MDTRADAVSPSRRVLRAVTEGGTVLPDRKTVHRRGAAASRSASPGAATARQRLGGLTDARNPLTVQDARCIQVAFRPFGDGRSTPPHLHLLRLLLLRRRRRRQIFIVGGRATV